MPMQPNLRSVSSTQSERRDARPAPPMNSLTSPFEMMGAPMSLRLNGEIYGEGEPADCACKIVSGAVRTSKGLADGLRQIGAFYLAGDVFGLEVGEGNGFWAAAR